MIKKFKVGNLAIIAVILFITVANLTLLAHGAEDNCIAHIIIDGKIMQEIKLDEIGNRVEIEKTEKYNIRITGEHGRIC